MIAGPTPADRTPVVHVVDDHDGSRKAAERVLGAARFAVKLYASAEDYVGALPEGHGCLVLDLRMPGASGLELQESLALAPDPMPIVFLSGHADVPKARQAFKAGAADFLTKPVDAKALVAAVTRALAKDAEDRAARKRGTEAHTRYERLTPREREVFAYVIGGQLNKQIAYELGTTEHTVKVHRGRLMAKLEADSVADLVRIALDLGVSPIGSPR